MADNNLEVKYPWEIVSKVQTKRTFSVEAAFGVNATEDKPLNVFNKFSRYKLCVIENGVATTANIPIDILSAVEKKTDKAVDKYLDFLWASKSEEGNTPAYTTRFFAGDLKGKSPVDVLLEEGGKAKLESQKKYLEDNLAKYPKNKNLIDAINEALSMDQTNIATTIVAPPPMKILEIGTRPLESKKREDGMWFCYEVKVILTPSNNYPVSVEVANYYAPVERDKNNLLNVLLSKKDKESELVNTYYMSIEDWLDVVDKMVSEKNEFIRLHKADAYVRAEKASEENRRNGKNKEKAKETSKPTPVPSVNESVLVQMRVVSKTACKERQLAPGNFAMEVTEFETGEKKNIVFPAEEIKKIPEKTWNTLLERSANTETPLDFSGNFEETYEGNIRVYIFKGFAK